MKKIPLVAPDGHLARQIALYDEQHRFETVRFTTVANALEKTQPNEMLIIQWTVAEIIETLKQANGIARPFIVYCPELAERTAKEGENIRLALLQFGAAAVFSQGRKLPQMLAICSASSGSRGPGTVA
ncbi:MAG: hypothetical protein LBN39_02435 [Planctomycetaceae bacterium]|jgi:hypothetical protein|nr:hypothetical protein [Planctomycetaceae bacterium]